MTRQIILDRHDPRIVYLCSKDAIFQKVVDLVGPISYSLHSDIYEFLIQEIIEQMLNAKVSEKMFCRLKELCEGDITIEAISSLTDTQLKSIGISFRKVSTIRGLNKCISNGELYLSKLPSYSDEAVLKRLTLIKGIGNWTAKMVLIFSLGREDVLPYEDAAFRHAFCWAYQSADTSVDYIIEKCRKWKPYSSVAARYMYRALDMGLTKTPLFRFT